MLPWYLLLLLIPALLTAQPLSRGDLSAPVPTPPSGRHLHLWPSYHNFNIGVLGYREVSETDLFTVRSFNPNGPDLVTQAEYHPVTRMGLYPLLTITGAYHRNLPLVTKEFFRLHFEYSFEGMWQRLIAPSAFNNTITSPDHYTIGYHQMPSVAMAQASTGLWLCEIISVGFSFTGLSYRINTNDDRVTAIQLTDRRVTALPYFAFWIPLEKTAMNRWSLTGRSSLSVAGSDLKIPDAEIKFLRLSTERTGRAVGLFARYCNLGGFEDLKRFPDFKIHHDKQFMLGISMGTGGLNRTKGR